MKQTESKDRYFHAGIIVLVVLTLLASCGWGLPEDLQESQPPLIGKKIGDPVTVRIAVPKPDQSGNSARSADPDLVEFFANYYEVVFRKIGVSPDPDTYYRGMGIPSQGYINVTVPVGTGYEVLLLAGYNRTLLGGGYLGKNNSPANPVEIKAGQVNVVSIPVKVFPPLWNTDTAKTGTFNDNDFIFEAALTGYGGTPALKIEPRYINLAPYIENDPGPDAGAHQIDPSDAKFTVMFNLAKFTPLILADISGTNDALSIAEHNVRLYPRYDKTDHFPPVVLTPSVSPTDITFTNNPALTNGKLPNRDADGLLAFELTYYAFGAEDSGGISWIIRNGLSGSGEDSVPDGDTGRGIGTGTCFLVKFGKGTPDSLSTITKVPLN
jgi:hypothetical protein